MPDHDRDPEATVTWKPSVEQDAPLLEDRVTEPGSIDPDSGNAEPRPLMQQLLAHYCSALESELTPLLDPLLHVGETLQATTELPAQTLLPGMRELRTQLTQLVAKVAEQQAYVLIFGPLKSGKSTFMNAICATYVSEVTSLPAYPCLVQVSHAADTQYRVTRYDGDTATFSDPAQLHEALEASHRELVEMIRRTEASGEDFEPHRHAPQAMMRIDIRAPAGDLADSGAVLVDTPGLYSRMKFGYDRMTRDFRDAAASAIFVVKTDNLFLDQVFDEFEELLALFSRIFLIVNLDAAKRDLQPDGSLRPSIEHEDPQAVVRAFENLSMSAAVKRAREAGRLRIYPVDLLGAASQRIRANRPGGNGTAANAQTAGADFDLLLQDLTEYLNSNEYLRGFVADSLRRARSLLAELLRLLDDDAVRHLESRVQRLGTEHAELEERKAALERLRAIDWRQQFEPQRTRLAEVVRAQIDPIGRNAAHSLNGAVDAWFGSDASLLALQRNDVEPTFARCREDCLRLVRETLDSELVQAGTGEAMGSELRRDFERVEIDPTSHARSALAELRVGDRVTVQAPALGHSLLPVRRTLLDWLLLRSSARVRDRLFGPPETPDRPIAPDAKARRLGDAGREAITGKLQDAIGPFVERAQRQVPAEAFDAYVKGWSTQLSRTLDAVLATTQSRLETVAALRAEARGVLDTLQALKALATPTVKAVTALNDRFGRSGVAPAAQDPSPSEPEPPSAEP
jgi:hypothetical protein